MGSENSYPNFETSREQKSGTGIIVGIDAPGRAESFGTKSIENRALQGIAICF